MSTTETGMSQHLHGEQPVSNKFKAPEQTKSNKVNHKVIGVTEGSSVREVLFESTDYDEFTKAYRYHYSTGNYIAVFKEHEQLEEK